VDLEVLNGVGVPLEPVSFENGPGSSAWQAQAVGSGPWPIVQWAPRLANWHPLAIGAHPKRTTNAAVVSTRTSCLYDPVSFFVLHSPYHHSTNLYPHPTTAYINTTAYALPLLLINSRRRARSQCNQLQSACVLATTPVAPHFEKEQRNSFAFVASLGLRLSAIDSGAQSTADEVFCAF